MKTIYKHQKGNLSKLFVLAVFVLLVTGIVSFAAMSNIAWAYSPDEALLQAKTDLANMLHLTDIEKDAIHMVTNKPPQFAYWANNCYGWPPLPGQTCVNGTVTGYKVYLELYGIQYEFHAGILDPMKRLLVIELNDIRMRDPSIMLQQVATNGPMQTNCMDPETVTVFACQWANLGIRRSDGVPGWIGAWDYNATDYINIFSIVKNIKVGETWIDFLTVKKTHFADLSWMEYWYDLASKPDMPTRITFGFPVENGDPIKVEAKFADFWVDSSNPALNQPVYIPPNHPDVTKPAIKDLVFNQNETASILSVSNYRLISGPACAQTYPIQCEYTVAFDLLVKSWQFKYEVAVKTRGDAWTVVSAIPNFVGVENSRLQDLANRIAANNYDLSGDGTVNNLDILQARGLYPEAIDHPNRLPADVAQALDVDGNGVLDNNDLQIVYSKIRTVMRIIQAAKDLAEHIKLKNYDLNHDGIVNTSDYITARAFITIIPYSANLPSDVFTTLDLNRDGVLNNVDYTWLLLKIRGAMNR